MKANNSTSKGSLVRPMLGVALVALTLLGGCVYANTKRPGPINYFTQYTLTSKDFKILGPVEAKGTVKMWFYMVATGGNGYEELLQKAKAMGGHGLMNYTFSIDNYSIMTWFYNKATWRAHAIAVQYNISTPDTPKPAPKQVAPTKQ